MRRASRGQTRSSGEIHLTTDSEGETRALGIRLGGLLPIPSVILLRGSLGTGKTTLTRGIAQGLGLEDPSLVSSPSFTLVNIYQGRCPIYHVDLYRLAGNRDFYSIGLDEILGADGVTIVEWSERLEYPVESAIVIEIKDLGGDRRFIKLTQAGKYSYNREFDLLSDPGQ